MVVNRQKRVAVDVVGVRNFVQRLRGALKLGRRDFNVCFVDDPAIKRLNARYRDRARPTDVLAFAWDGVGEGSTLPRAARDGPSRAKRNGARDFADFLGDVIISVEMARRNARAEGHSTANEIRWLILHGVLHLLGYDHAADQGEMTALEHSLRARLRLAGDVRPRHRG